LTQISLKRGLQASGQLRLVDLRELDTESVIGLLQLSLGNAAVERSAAFFRWKHESNPFGRSFGIGAIEPGGRLVAVRLFLRWKFSFGGATVHAVRAVDTATHPEWQRRGLFRRLTLELVDRLRQQGVVELVFNTPNPKSRAGYLGMGWRDVGRLPLSLRPSWRRLARLPARARGEAAGLGSIEELLRVPSLAGFLQRWHREAASAPPRLHTVRDDRYLAWRYGEVPGPRYRAAWSIDGDSGAVVIVRERRRRERAELSFSELLVAGGVQAERAASALVRTVSRSTGDYAVALGFPESSERRALGRAGFWPVRAVAPRLTWRPIGEGFDAGRMASWRLSAGDVELF
jgi:GNAT superfamily N-acetyltransferase